MKGMKSIAFVAVMALTSVRASEVPATPALPATAPISLDQFTGMFPNGLFDKNAAMALVQNVQGLGTAIAGQVHEVTAFVSHVQTMWKSDQVGAIATAVQFTMTMIPQVESDAGKIDGIIKGFKALEKNAGVISAYVVDHHQTLEAMLVTELGAALVQASNASPVPPTTTDASAPPQPPASVTKAVVVADSLLNNGHVDPAKVAAQVQILTKFLSFLQHSTGQIGESCVTIAKTVQVVEQGCCKPSAKAAAKKTGK